MSIHEIQSFDFTNESQVETTTGLFLRPFFSRTKLYILIVLTALCILILLGRSMYLQVFRGSYFTAQAQDNRTKKEIITPSRGIIYDSNMTPLVKNLPVFTLSITPARLPIQEEERLKVLKDITIKLSLDPVSLITELEQYPYTYKYKVPVLKDLSYEQALSYISKISSLQAVDLTITNKRVYTSSYFSHLLGYTVKVTEDDVEKDSFYDINDTRGSSGLEQSYESNLRGEKGVSEVEIDSFGKSLSIISQQKPIQGDSLVLSIDAKLQTKVSELAENYARKIGRPNISVIMSEPKTGKILSFVSLPYYNNNDFSGGISHDTYDVYLKDLRKPLFNRIVLGEYPSGSTIKTVVAAAALEEGVITDQTHVVSVGGIWVQNQWYFPDWKAGGHGYTNVYKAIADSVNTFFYYIGGGYEEFEGLGLDRLIEYYQKFGLGEKTGIDLPNERTGLVPTRDWKQKVKKEEWYIGDTYHIAIGQGDLLVTPLQVNQYTSVFANGGKLLQPQLVKSTIDADGVQKDIPSKLLRKNIVSDDVINIVRTAMRRTVTEGSARYLNSLSVTSAGKTGTAQFAKNKQPHAWYTGFAPYEEPEVVITALIEEGGEGSSVTVPLVYEILNYYFGEYKK